AGAGLGGEPNSPHAQWGAKAARRDLTVGSKFCFQPRQQQCGGNRGSPDRSKQITIKFRSRSDLAAREQRKQGPICAREQKERHRTQQRCTQMPVVPRVAETGTNGAVEPARPAGASFSSAAAATTAKRRSR